MLAGFQGKLASGRPTSGHVAEALAVLQAGGRVLDAIWTEVLGGWVDDLGTALFSVICHHGGPVPDERIEATLPTVSAQLHTTIYGHQPLIEMSRLIGALMAAFSTASSSTPQICLTAPLSHLLAGITMAADWLASNPSRFPLTCGAEELRPELARQAVEALR